LGFNGCYRRVPNCRLELLKVLTTARQWDSATVGQRGMAAAGKMLTAILSHAADQSGLKADWPRIAAS